MHVFALTRRQLDRRLWPAVRLGLLGYVDNPEYAHYTAVFAYCDGADRDRDILSRLGSQHRLIVGYENASDHLLREFDSGTCDEVWSDKHREMASSVITEDLDRTDVLPEDQPIAIEDVSRRADMHEGIADIATEASWPLHRSDCRSSWLPAGRHVPVSSHVTRIRHPTVRRSDDRRQLSSCSS